MSLRGAIMGSAKKMKEGIHHIEVEPMESGGCLITHRMHDYEHPMHAKKYHAKSHGALNAHMKEYMPMGGESKEAEGAEGENE